MAEKNFTIEKIDENTARKIDTHESTTIVDIGSLRKQRAELEDQIGKLQKMLAEIDEIIGEFDKIK